MELVEDNLTSQQLGGGRRLWLEPAPAANVCVFLDGEIYRDRVGAPAVVDRLRQQGLWLDTRCVFVSHLDGAARHTDFICAEAYNRFLLDELLPRLPAAQTYLVGLSLSGLAAAYVACCRPTRFAGVVCQSPSAWWHDQWLVRWAASQDLAGLRLWLSVGSRETGEDLRHPPSEMHQQSSQLAAVTRLAEVLPHRGAELRFHCFDGGHDPVCWAAELPTALTWL